MPVTVWRLARLPLGRLELQVVAAGGAAAHCSACLKWHTRHGAAAAAAVREAAAAAHPTRRHRSDGVDDEVAEHGRAERRARKAAAADAAAAAPAAAAPAAAAPAAAGAAATAGAAASAAAPLRDVVSGDFSVELKRASVYEMMADFSTALARVVGKGSNGKMRDLCRAVAGNAWALRLWPKGDVDADQAAAAWHVVGASDEEDIVLQAVLQETARSHPQRYPSLEVAWQQFDLATWVAKHGHMGNLRRMKSAVLYTAFELFDELMFIFNADGRATGRPWHIGAHPNVAVTFMQWTPGKASCVMEPHVSFELRSALRLIGIPHVHLGAAVEFGKQKARVMRVERAYLCLADLLLDCSPMLLEDTALCAFAAAGSCELQDAGFAFTMRGPVPVRGALSGVDSDDDFHAVLLVSSYPNERGQLLYNASMQRHRPQACLYFWSFEAALRWLWKDKYSSVDRGSDWASDLPETSAVIVAYVAAVAGCVTWEDVPHKAAWARSLANAYRSDDADGKDEHQREWPGWVPDWMRAPLTPQERAVIAPLQQPPAPRGEAGNAD